MELVKMNEEVKETIDSREVATMMDRTHSELLQMIQGSGKNLGIIPVLTKGNFHVVDYFIESTYKDNKGEERECYLCTKMGCEMLGSKLQGEKGILFSAKYVKRFNEMEKEIKKHQPKLPTTYKEALKQLLSQVEENEKLLEDNNKLSIENEIFLLRY